MSTASYHSSGHEPVEILAGDLAQERAENILKLTRPLIERKQIRTWLDFMAAGLRISGREVPDDPRSIVDMSRAVAGVGAAIGALPGSRIMAAYRDVPDTTEGWVGVVAAESFRAFTLYVAHTASRLHLLERGSAAEQVSLDLLGQNIRVARYAGSATLTEEDIIDGGEMNVTLALFDELGRAAAALKPDLVYAVLMGATTLAGDGVALFDAAAHGNLATGGGSALGTDTLDVGVAAVEGQTLDDEEGNSIPAGVPARFLVVPPAKKGLGRRLAAAMWLGDGGELVVRSEPRLSVGVINPANGEAVAGSATAWYVAGPAAVRPSIVVGALGGRLEPRIRTSELTEGRWGLVYDVALDLGVAALDWRPLYKGAGA